MNKFLKISAASLVVLCSPSFAVENEGQVAYAVCSACHLAAGEGIPSAFPPLRNRIAEIAATDAGRNYVLVTVLNGLVGQISVAGTRYAGFMPGQGATLSDSQISAVLNYIALDLSDTDAEFTLFSAAEVANARSAKNPPASELRAELGLD